MEMTHGRQTTSAIYAATGLVLFLALWQLAGKAAVAGPVLPALSDVAVTLFAPENLSLLTRSALSTLDIGRQGIVSWRFARGVAGGRDASAATVAAGSGPPGGAGKRHASDCPRADPDCGFQPQPDSGGAGWNSSILSFLRSGFLGTGLSFSGAARRDDGFWRQRVEAARSSGIARRPCRTLPAA